MTRAERRARADAHVQAYLSSEQTIPVYCRTHDIPLGTFQGWLDRHRQEERTQSLGFISLGVSPCQEPSSLTVSLVTSKGTVLTISGSITLTELSDLVLRLESC